MLLNHAEWLHHDVLASLLEWSPTVIVPAEELEQLLSFDVKPDVIIASPHQREPVVKEWQQLAPVVVLERAAQESVLRAALHFLLAKKYRAINILDWSPGESTPSLALFLEQMDVVFYNPASRWIWARNGTYKKWLPKGNRLTIFHPDGERAAFQMDGLIERPNAGKGRLSLEAKQDGIVTIKAEAAFALEEYF